LDFDRKCDGSLPLEEMIKPDPELRKLLQDIDRSKARVWGLTNAYSTHAKRVLSILGITDQFEGLVYCDYASPRFACKPETEFFNNALTIAGVTDPSKCYFIDDSKNNVVAAWKLGWRRCVHFSERGLQTVEGGQSTEITSGPNDVPSGIEVINHLQELRSVWSELFV